MDSEDDTVRDPIRGFAFALAGAFVVSSNFVTAKFGLRGFDSETFSLVWTTAAALYALTIVLVFGQRKQLRLPRHTVGRVVVLGLATGIGMVFSWAGLSRLDPAFASFLWRLSPVLTIILAGVFLGEGLSINELPAAGLVLIGGIMSVAGDWQVVSVRSGTVLTLLASLSAAFQRFIAKTVADDVHPNVLTFYRVGVGSVAVMVWSLVRGSIDLDVAPVHWIATLSGAFLGPCLSFLLTYRSFRYWDLSRSTLLLMSQPMFVLVMAYVAFGTLPSGRQLAGGLAILIGAVWFVAIHLRHSRQSDRHAEL
jgi:transporter family protein